MTVKELMEKLSTFHEDFVVSMQSRNYGMDVDIDIIDPKTGERVGVVNDRT